MTIATPTEAATWWMRDGLDVASDGSLRIAGEDAEALAREHGTPLFIYDRQRFADNARRLQAAFARAEVPFRLRFALKACPDPRLLEILRSIGTPGSPDAIGIDACSPGEVRRALECGWRPDEISYTGTNVSERDLDVLLQHDIHCNIDGLSQLERYGRRAPGRRVGLRIDPAMGAGYNADLEYSGDLPSKFGIALDRLDDALAVLARHDLHVDTIHLHAGSGWLGDALPSFAAALGPMVEAIQRVRAAGHDVREANIGGGLGVPARADERAVDVDAYAAVVASHLAPLGVTVAAEPGDYIAKDTGILLAEVVSIEERRGVTFVGLDAGWNVNCSYFIYRYAQEIVPCRRPTAERTERVTIAGHINEAGDLFAEDYAMAPVDEGDIVAILNAGGYHQAMSSTHCLRPMAEAVYLDR